MKRPRSMTISRDHFLAVFVNSDGEQMILVQDRGLPPVLFDGKQVPTLVTEVTKLPGSATTWVASGLLLANDEGIWLKTSLLAASRWFRSEAA